MRENWRYVISKLYVVTMKERGRSHRTRQKWMAESSCWEKMAFELNVKNEKNLET